MPSAASTPRRCRTALFAWLLAAGWLGGCAESEPPWARTPVLHFDAQALSTFLERSARLEGTPLGTASRRLLERIADCREVWATPDAEAADPIAPEAFGCAPGAEAPTAMVEAVRAQRGAHDGLVRWPLGEEGLTELRFDLDEQGDLTVEGRLWPGSVRGPLALLVPGDEPPAPAVITPERSLIHLRVRPRDGVRIADWIAPGSQGDRLFALKGRLLEGALLAGTWELAFVGSEAGTEVPLAVAALHHRGAAATRSALDEALDQLEATWPIRRSSRRFVDVEGRALEGGCFLDLPILPEFAPCWVVTSRAFVIGYRGEALDAALRGPASGATPAGDPVTPEASRLSVHLDRIGALDGRGPAGSADRRAPRPSDLWSRLELHASEDPGGPVVLSAKLRSGA